MARRRIDHRGVRFSIVVDAAGYEWQWEPIAGTDEDVLMPAGLLVRTETRIVMNGKMRKLTTRSGLGVARDAYRKFHALAEIISHTERRTLYRKEIEGEPGAEVPVFVTDTEECRTRIVDYANQFGPLWGDSDNRTLHDWQKEAARFLALHDVARVLRPGADTRDFEHRVHRMPHGELRYVPGRLAPYLTIANEGAYSESRRSANALSVRSEPFKAAIDGGPRVQARMLLNRAINKELAGGLDWNVSLLGDRDAAVVPRHLIHLLYLRLWLDTVDGSNLERQRTCLSCGRELPRGATTRRKYCDNNDQCRTDYHNRRRAKS